jgi:hypothetical protein
MLQMILMLVVATAILVVNQVEILGADPSFFRMTKSGFWLLI